MLGLEYALQIFEISKADLAKELDIDRSNITIWLSGLRSIPKKYLPRLAEKFNMPEEYLTSQVDDLRKLEIENIKLRSEIEFEEIEDTLIDENGEEVTYMRDVLVNGSIESIDMKEANIEYLKSVKRLQAHLNFDSCENINEVITVMYDNTQLFKLFAEIMESKSINKHHIKKIFNAVLIHLNERKGFGKLYEFQDDSFVKKLVKLLEEEEVNQRKEVEELWGSKT